nr:MAG TPA: hypothetical protein [Caudoviricetes sp.]
MLGYQRAVYKEADFLLRFIHYLVPLMKPHF